jgi:hypothetical protein
MASKPYVCVIDFETGGQICHKDGRLDVEAVEPIQVAFLALHPDTLKLVPGSEFCSMMRATSRDVLNPGALAVNKKTPDEIMAAPERSIVWKRFSEHVKKYNVKGGSIYGAPIAAGKNIRGFDMDIVHGLCQKWGPCDKGGRQTLFNQRTMLDLEDDIWRFFSHRDELVNHKMDTLRDYFGISHENSHDALVDCRQTAWMIAKYIKLYRNISHKVSFKNSAKDGTSID